MAEKFTDYTVEDLTITEEVRVVAEEQKTDKSKRYDDYTEKDLIEQSPILEDVFEALENQDWQIIARVGSKTLISPVFKDQLLNISDIEVIAIESEYFFEIIDRQSRFTSDSMKKKVSKVRNSANYYWLAEEIKVETLQLKGNA